MDLDEFRRESQRLKAVNRAFYDKIKKRPPADLDGIFRREHDEAFEAIDCLSCANCCKTTSPVFYQRDVERAARGLRLTPGSFIEKYLKTDDEGDLVLKSAPCPFLAGDNHCAIYDNRPAACREYPHTNRKRMHQILDLTFRNSLVCPAVLRITKNLIRRMEE